MKIMFCLGGLEKGGAERVVCNLANYLVKQGNEVALIINSDKNKAYELDSKIDIKLLDKKNKNKCNFLERNFLRIRNLKKFIINYKPDVILAFLQEPTARLLFLKTFDFKIRKIPVIVSVRIDPKVAFKTLKRKLGLMLYKNAEGFVFQTNEAKTFFKEKIQLRSVVIGNPINPLFFKEDYSFDNTKDKIVSVGRLTQQKNYPMLLKAFKNVLQEYPKYELEIYGDGELKDDLKEYTKKLKITNSVHFMGNVDDIQSYMMDAKMFIITSNYEGMSNALMEAMAMGLPCISTNSSGGGASTLIVNGENGILVPKENIDFLTNQILELLSDPDKCKKISNNSKESMKNYNPENINNLWLNYIKRIVGDD